MNRFEQLIEYVINDDTKKAEELFHEIVVEKSRTIYESLMAEEADAELDEAAEEEVEESLGGDASVDCFEKFFLRSEGSTSRRFYFECTHKCGDWLSSTK